MPYLESYNSPTHSGRTAVRLLQVVLQSDCSTTWSLLTVLIVAKAIALAGHDVPLWWWSPIAFFWHDAAVVLGFGILSKATAELATRSAVAFVYAVLALYVALNVPVTRVLSTPLTWAMWRAARGPLSDSIAFYATWDNVLLTMTVVALAIGLPSIHRHGARGFSRAFARLKARAPFAIAVLAAFVALGPIAAQRVDTRGLERNAFTALIWTTMPRAHARAEADRWTTTGFEHTIDADLTALGGAAAGRHIVMVSLESTAAQYLGLYGATPDVMPNLSALADDAIVFDHAYAVYPESIKGLFSVLCSSYPALDTAAESYDAAPCASIAAILGRRGYRTALFHSGRFGYLGMESMIRNRGYDRLEDAGDISGRHNSSFGVDEPSTVARILSWIDGVAKGDRFFVTYLPIAGHHPYETPERGPFPERSDLDRYRNALHDGDSALGTLIQGLRARGLEEQTLWIVFGDHGEAFGQHDGNYGHTFQIFDENVRVPMLIAAPGLIDRPVRRQRVVSLIDVAPTLLDLIGEPLPNSGQRCPCYRGHSMLAREPRIAFFFADYSRGLVGLRDGRFKMIYELDSHRAKLYDLAEDAGERRDIAQRDPDRAAWYERNLRGFSASLIPRP